MKKCFRLFFMIAVVFVAHDSFSMKKGGCQLIAQGEKILFEEPIRNGPLFMYECGKTFLFKDQPSGFEYLQPKDEPFWIERKMLTRDYQDLGGKSEKALKGLSGACQMVQVSSKRLKEATRTVRAYKRLGYLGSGVAGVFAVPLLREAVKKSDGISSFAKNDGSKKALLCLGMGFLSYVVFSRWLPAIVEEKKIYYVQKLITPLNFFEKQNNALFRLVGNCSCQTGVVRRDGKRETLRSISKVLSLCVAEFKEAEKEERHVDLKCFDKLQKKIQSLKKL